MSLVHFALGYLAGLTYVVNWFDQRNKAEMTMHTADASKSPNSEAPTSYVNEKQQVATDEKKS
jgi:hypothetical protein